MNMFRALTIAVLSMTSALHAQNAAKAADKSDCGIVYGKAHAFNICAPSGWVLDNSILNDQGIYAAFYPQHSSWEEAQQNGSVMYVNTAAKETNKDIETLMRTDAEDTRKRAPSVQVSELDDLKLKEGSARVQLFKNGEFGRTDAVAYIDTPKIIVMLALSSKDQKSFDRDYSSFAELARSYSFLTSQVSMPQK